MNYIHNFNFKFEPSTLFLMKSMKNFPYFRKISKSREFAIRIVSGFELRGAMKFVSSNNRDFGKCVT